MQYVFNNCCVPLFNRIQEHLCSRAVFLENAMLASEVTYYHIYWVRQNIFEGARCPLPEYILVLIAYNLQTFIPKKKPKKKDCSQQVGYLTNLLILDANVTKHWYYSFFYKVK